MRNQRGFSLLETMVAGAVVAAVAYYVVGAVRNTFWNNMDLNDRLIANQLVQERISKMKGLAGYYLPVSGTGGEGLIVGCFDRRGLARENPGLGVVEKLVFGRPAGSPSGVCNNRDVEVQFKARVDNSSLLDAYVIVNRPDREGFTMHQRTIRLQRAL